MSASVAQVRARFPALQRQHAGHPVAYFDGPGGTQVPQSVVEAMSDYLLHHNANTHWAYPTSNETDAMLLAARSSSQSRSIASAWAASAAASVVCQSGPMRCRTAPTSTQPPHTPYR